MLIKAFVNAWSFIDANQKAEELMKIDTFSVPQLNMIIQGFVDNDQIRGAWTASEYIQELFQKHRALINEELQETFRRVLYWE